MSEGAPTGRGTRLQWRRIALALCFTVPFVLLEPSLPVSTKAQELLAIAAVGVVGYLWRRRTTDALLYVVAHTLAGFADPAIGASLLACMSMLLLAVSRRPRFSLAVGSAVLVVMLAGIELKIRFGASALTFQDLRYFFRQFRDNAGVIASQPTLVAYAAFAMIGSIALGVFAWRLDRPVGAAARRRGPPFSRAGLPALALLVAGLAGAEVNRVAWIESTLDGPAPSWLPAGVVAHARPWAFSELEKGNPLAKFFSTIYLESTPRYRPVDTAAFRREVKKLVQTRVAMGAMPDIVVILQESQFNPLAILGCPAALCRIPVFEPDGFTRDHGAMRVHTHGGGTWMTEFALLNGVPHTLYGVAGEFAPFNIAPGVTRSFVRSLKDLGYRTVGVYPVPGGMMNARLAYAAYGFDEFYDSHDLDLPGGFSTPDALIHAALARVLERERSKGGPVFVMALTIFNHGEHGIKMARVPRDLVEQAQATFGPGVDADNLADYLWRSREFGDAHAGTRRRVLGAGRPAVLAWFGDHLPPFANAPGLAARIGSQGETRAPARFLTWYQVDSNVGGKNAGVVPKVLDIVFLPGLLADRAGLPLDEWLAANIVARERCDGLLVECEGNDWHDAYLTFLLRDLQSIR